MRLRLLSLLLPCLLLTACAAPEEVETRPKQYQATFLDVFDTVTTVMGYAESQEVFTETAEMAHDLLLEYHQLYDIYNDYEGIHNLKTVNDQAGIAPVTVDARILDLLLLCRDLYADSGGKVNAAMGSVLLLWHEAVRRPSTTRSMPISQRRMLSRPRWSIPPLTMSCWMKRPPRCI